MSGSRFLPATRLRAASAFATFVVLLCISPPPPARATLVPQWVSVPISPAALAADPALHHFRTYDLQITQTREHWASGDLEIKLNAGHFYVPDVLDDNYGRSDRWAAHPNLEFDTFITSPDSLANPFKTDGSGTFDDFFKVHILGGGTYPTNHGASAPIMPAASNSADQIDISWGELTALQSAFGDSTFTVARLTLSNDADATIGGRVGGTSTVNGQQVTTYYQPASLRVVPVPEPASVGALGSLASVGLLARRRRRSNA